MISVHVPFVYKDSKSTPPSQSIAKQSRFSFSIIADGAWCHNYNHPVIYHQCNINFPVHHHQWSLKQSSAHRVMLELLHALCERVLKA